MKLRILVRGYIVRGPLRECAAVQEVVAAYLDARRVLPDLIERAMHPAPLSASNASSE